MRPKLSANMRSQLRAQTLVQSRLEAVPRLVKAAAQAEHTAALPGRSGEQVPAGAPAVNVSALPAHMKTGFAALAKLWRWLLSKRQAQVSSKRLRVIETASLGEKRFVAVLRVDGAQFLIGGGANTVSLLASLEAASGEGRFAQILQQTAQDGSAAQ